MRDGLSAPTGNVNSLSGTCTPGQAYWNQRLATAKCRDRLLALIEAVDRTYDLSMHQFAQLFAMALEFGPDLVIELGRGLGNSTCAFTEAANQLEPHSCRVLSLCNSTAWEEKTVPKLRGVVPDAWFQPLEAVQTDIAQFDFQARLRGAERVLVFWDAHGFEIAEVVLGQLMPLLARLEHVVLIHDMSDMRYCLDPLAQSTEYPMWKGTNGGDGAVRIGHIQSEMAQAISIMDFTTRNRLTLESADHSIHQELSGKDGKIEEMRKLLGDDLFRLHGQWFWFTLNESPGPYKFPIPRRTSEASAGQP